MTWIRQVDKEIVKAGLSREMCFADHGELLALIALSLGLG